MKIIIIAFIMLCYMMPIQVIENKTWLDICNSTGQAHLGFIILVHSDSKDKSRIIRHEKIHLQQQKELFIIGFYIAYGCNYLYNLSRYDDREVAYESIIFEVKARENEN